jgi:hypothetical protein
MKQFTILLRVPVLIYSILMVSLCFHSSLLAQTKKQVTPGTFSRLPTPTSPAAASGLQQFYSSTGHYTISADGIGSLDTSMNIRVNKPNAGATVEKAILISSVTSQFGETIDNGCVTIAGVPVNWDGTASVSFFNNYWADVTSIVASTINGFSAGISTLPITECNTGIIEGEALLVVFNDPSATEKTIIVMLGAENPEGDNFSVTLAQPIDPNAPGATLDMGLGIGFGYQVSTPIQASQVSVNGQRISSSAGGQDDGVSANGGLITVGGIGDTNDNPPDPFADPTDPRSDDELYSILPFIDSTTTSLTINTINPSLDDNIFLAYFVTSGAAIVGEGILLSQTSDTANVGDDHTVKATVVNSLGQPVTDRSVTFTVTSGPNAGNTFSATTDSSGNAFYTYTGSGGVGTDSIQACFTNSQNETSCSNTLAFVWVKTTVTVPQCCDGTNLIANPGFEEGNTGFASQYTYQSEISDASVKPGYYTIGSSADAHTISPTWNVNCAADGKHLLVNGLTGAANRTIWKQNVSVEYGKIYNFCIDLKNLPQCGFDVKPKVGIHFVLNSGDSIAAIYKEINVSGSDSCNWQRIQKEITIPSGSGNATLTISINLKSQSMGDGNDLAIDNISFVELKPVEQQQLLYDIKFFNANQQNFSISADPITPLGDNCTAYWEVAELDNNYNVISGTEVVNPSVWANADPNTFNGYEGTSTLGDTTQPGIFSYNKRYQIVYGRTCKCASFNSLKTIIDPISSKGDIRKIRVFTNAKEVLNSRSQINMEASNGSVSMTIQDNKFNSQQGFNLFPNPVKDRLTVAFSKVSDKSKLIIFDAKGSMLKEISVNTGDTRAEINTSNFAAGSYLIKLFNNNQIIGTKLFIKQ